MVEALQTELRKDPPMWLVGDRAWRDGPHSEARATGLTLLLRRLDVWTRRWTPRKTGVVDPFPASLFPTASVDEEAGCSPRRLRGEFDRRTWVLDVIDECHGGYTLSEERCARSLPTTVCGRCKVAVRGAVEAFLESSSRAHVDVQSRAWLDGVTLEWNGAMEPVMDTMWASVFVDHTALRVEDDGDPSGQAHIHSAGEVTSRTKQLLLFLFLVARSIVNETPSLGSARSYIQSNLHTSSWWESYWRELLGVVGASGRQGTGEVAAPWRQEIQRAKEVVLWRMRNRDMNALLRCFVADLQPEPATNEVLCGTANCALHCGTAVVAHDRGAQQA